MKKLKIRFIEEYSLALNETINYYIEEKKWYGWKRLYYTIDIGYGSIFTYFYSDDKQKLLKEILKYKKWSQEYTSIVEYPSIKEYIAPKND